VKLDNSIVGVSSSLETAELYKALCKAQAAYTPIKRSGLNKVEGFRYATLRDICDALMPGLLANGFTMPTFMVGFDREIRQWVMVGTLTHSSDQWISSVCPLLMGYQPEDRPGIQTMEIGATYAKKILMQGLCGGWLESEEGEPQPQPKAEPVQQEAAALPAPVKQRKKAKPQALSDEARDLLDRAKAKLEEKADDPERCKKIWEHLDLLVSQGSVPSSEVLLLKSKHSMGAKVVGVEQGEEVVDAE